MFKALMVFMLVITGLVQAGQQQLPNVSTPINQVQQRAFPVANNGRMTTAEQQEQDALYAQVEAQRIANYAAEKQRN